jgi:asparagine synthetase B (glutamine-hydrolysing)
MGASGIADEADALGIEVVFAGLGADELHGGLHVVDRGRIDARFSQPVINGKNRIARARKEQTPKAIKLLVADLPAATMNGDRLAAALRQIKIADKFGAVVLGEDEVRVVDHLILRSGCLTCGEQRHHRCGQDELGEHRQFSLQASAKCGDDISLA